MHENSVQYIEHHCKEELWYFTVTFEKVHLRRFEYGQPTTLPLPHEIKSTNVWSGSSDTNVEHNTLWRKTYFQKQFLASVFYKYLSYIYMYYALLERRTNFYICLDSTGINWRLWTIFKRIHWNCRILFTWLYITDSNLFNFNEYIFFKLRISLKSPGRTKHVCNLRWTSILPN